MEKLIIKENTKIFIWFHPVKLIGFLLNVLFKTVPIWIIYRYSNHRWISTLNKHNGYKFIIIYIIWRVCGGRREPDLIVEWFIDYIHGIYLDLSTITKLKRYIWKNFSGWTTHSEIKKSVDIFLVFLITFILVWRQFKIRILDAVKNTWKFYQCFLMKRA